MKAFILGYKPVQFKPQGEQQEKKGLTVYYSAESPDCVGMFADHFWVDSDKMPRLYNLISRNPIDTPVPVDLKYEIIPTRKSPVLMDIEFLDEDAA